MKRKLNESLTFPVKIDVVRLVNENPELNGQMDKIASQIEDTTDATITKEESDGTVYMVIDGLTQDDIIDIFENDYYIDDVDNFFVYDDADDELDDVESDDDARAAAEDDMRDEYGDDYIDESCDDDARDCAIEDMKDEYGDDYIDMDEDYGLDDEGEWIDTEDDDYDDMIPDYDEVDPDDPDALDARDAAYADMEDDGIYDETYEDADEEFAGDDALNDSDDDSDDEFDECMEDSEFECYESLNNRKLRNRRRLLEKKKGCCPPKKGKKLVNLSEALKMCKAGLTTRDIVRSAKKPYLNESIISNAINKAKTEPRNDKKMKLIMKKKEIMQLKESLGAEKFNMICEAMKSGKKTLYSKKTINGKNITEYSAKELLELLNAVKKQHTNLMKSYKSLNESATKSTKRELRTAIENKERLMLILDEELTYRLTFKKLNKSKAINEDEENPLEPLSVDPTDGDSKDDNADASDDNADTESGDDTDETPDNDEEVELSRVVITVANQDAADELKQSLVDAGVPDDAIEFEDDDETDDSEDSDDTDSEADENSDENTDTDDTADETPNESLHYNKFKKLLEDDDSESDTADDSTDDNATDGEDSDASSDDNSDDNSDDSSDSEDKPIKVVLTNTDYVNDLADVLNNEYGISKEEFEEMIGGQIVDDSDSSDDSDDSSDSDDDKSDDENKEDEPSTNGDDAVDAMSQEELDKLFGGN